MPPPTAGTIVTGVRELLRAVARPLIGATFVIAGFDTARAPGGRVGKAAGLLKRLRQIVPLPEDDELIVRANAVAQVAAGATLAAGIAPRVSALALAGSLVPTTIAGHPFWEIDNPAERAQQRIHFLKNTGLFGGLLFVATVKGPRLRRSRKVLDH